ncbi:MAG: hypothetical protein NT169_25740 [Chloroflexi bacterium]|nr:hypothetical protein [Chloroflexota bacterium]
MSQTEEGQENRAGTPASTGEAGVPAVREAAVAYTTRPTRRTPPRPTSLRTATAPVVPVTPAADDDMASLQAAAEAGDVVAFERACGAINWQTASADRYADAVRHALWAGHHVLARSLAVEGAERFPNHAELRKAASILNPPYVVRYAPPDPGVHADMAWLDAHWREYRGQWVAIRNGELLGAAKVLDDLVARIGDIKGVMLAPVG